MIVSRYIKEKINEIFPFDKATINKALRNKNMNVNKFYELLISSNAMKRRNEFYSYFDSENKADDWWGAFTDWYISNHEKW